MSDVTPLSIILTYTAEKRENTLRLLDHEVRFPLVQMGNFSELLLDQQGLSDEQASIFQQIFKGSANLVSLVNRVICGDKESFADNMEQLSTLVTTLSSPLPLDLTLDQKGQRHLHIVDLGQRKFKSTFDRIFGIGSSETFFFKRYVEFYLTMNANLLAARGIKLFNQIQDFPIETDSLDYELVLDNLIGNAIKYGFPEGRDVRKKQVIKVNTFASHEPYLVRVSNNGQRLDLGCIVKKACDLGILPEDYEKMSNRDIRGILGGHDYSNLLQKYRIAKDYREQLLLQFAFFPGVSTSNGESSLDLAFGGGGNSQGHGLGIVKELVQKNGGDVWLLSDAERTNFYFTIPKERVISK